MKSTTVYTFVFGLALVVIAGLATAGSAGFAQNSNSSSASTNTNNPKPQHPKKVAARGRCDNTKQEQTDLSGTYTGKLKHGDEPAVDATLTVTGNNFTGTMGSETHSGRITAVTTCGYTAVTMMAEGAPRAMSLHAKRVGNNLTLTSAPGETQKMMFTSRGDTTTKPRKHEAKAKTTEAATPPAAESKATKPRKQKAKAKTTEAAAPPTTESEPTKPAKVSDCSESCARQADTCRRGCDYYTDPNRKSTCYSECDNGRSKCVGRCGN